MLSLAAVQDPFMADLKSNPGIFEPLPDVLRGRNGYVYFGALRTKPGRADSKPTLSMSCSDKIALWTIVGIQGALLSDIAQPLYIDQLVFGGVRPDHGNATLRECQRAFVTRLHSDIRAFRRKSIPPIDNGQSSPGSIRTAPSANKFDDEVVSIRAIHKYSRCQQHSVR